MTCYYPEKLCSCCKNEGVFEYRGGYYCKECITYFLDDDEYQEYEMEDFEDYFYD